MEHERQKVREWMMAAIDGECSPQDRLALEKALAADKSLQQEWQELQRVKELTQVMSIRKPPDEIWQNYWQSVYARLERGLAWIFVSLGAIALSAWGVWEAVLEITAESDMPGFAKMALAALFVGLVILLVSVVREKLFVRKSDPYKDIQR